MEKASGVAPFFGCRMQEETFVGRISAAHPTFCSSYKLQVTSLKLQEGDCVAFKMFRSSMVTFILFFYPLSALQIFQDFINAGLGIAKQHAGVFLVEQGIVDAGVA